MESYYTDEMKQKFQKLIENDNDYLFHMENFYKILVGLDRLMEKDPSKFKVILPMAQSLQNLVSIMAKTGKGYYYPDKSKW